jgi:hypothetical protein
MRKGLTSCTLAVVLAAAATAQTAPAPVHGSQPIAVIAIESASDATGVKIKVTIANNSDWLLGEGHAMELSPLKYQIRDEDGKAAAETEYGCKFHQSDKGCTPITTVHWSALYVKPGEKSEHVYDLSKEYQFDSRHTYSITAIGEHFVLVNAPRNVINSPRHPFGVIMNYRGLGYPYQELDTLHSNTIQIRPGS